MDDEERKRRRSIVTDELVLKVKQTVSKKGRFTIFQLSEDFLQMSRTILYGIVQIEFS